MSFTYDHPRPSVTVDLVLVAIEAADQGARPPRLLLIRRARAPFAGAWALPGGFLDMDEELADAARRELLEETHVDVGDLIEIGTFGRVGRDPRGRTLSVAFLAVHIGKPPTASAGDDASDARWHPWRRVPKLAFDHAEILARARAVLAQRAADDSLVELMPERFSLTELCAAYRLALGRDVDRTRLSARLRRSGVLRGTGERRGRHHLYTVGSSR